MLILELVVTPPAEGDRVQDLAKRLKLSGPVVNAGIAALVAAGLASRSGSIVRATPTALYLERLWPIAL